MKRSPITLALLLATFSVGVLPADPPAKPNIILIFADDISARELPVYGSSVWSPPSGGNTSDPKYHARTPVMDQLAREGCWVTTAWAATVCSPSRAMMMTGRYAHLHKWWDNKDIGQVAAKDGSLRSWPLYESSPRLIGHVAQQGGYATYWAGKTQMKGGDLQRFGFDEGVFTGGEGEDKKPRGSPFQIAPKKGTGREDLVNVDTGEPADSYVQSSWYWWPYVTLMNDPSAPGKIVTWPDTPESRKGWGPGRYGPDVELEYIFKFMARQKVQNKPFFIYHTTHLGHYAFDWLDPKSPNKWPGTPKIHWDGQGYTRVAPHVTGASGVYDTHGTVTESGIHRHIEYLDYQLWLYRRKLEQMGIADNTIIILCADNGTSGYGKKSPDRQKGAHVPLIIYAPGMTKHGRQDVLVNMADFLPTLADLTGATLPDDYEINGESLVPFLFGDKAAHRGWLYAYNAEKQMIRGTHVMRDGLGKWWDVTEIPTDVISFPPIKDWQNASSAHLAERDKLETMLRSFDKHATERDAPGVDSAPRTKNVGKRGKAEKPNDQ